VKGTDSTGGEQRHRPVMPLEVVEFLNLSSGKIVVDCTVGGGGHAKLILERILPHGLLIGIDSDDQMVAEAIRNLAVHGAAVKLFHGSFDNLRDILSKAEVERVDGVLFDLGMSSTQIANPERGFSFMINGPLDMRYDRRREVTAADIVNTKTEEELAEIIRLYGEERYARRIAAAIVERARRGRIETTRELADIIERAVPRYERRIHPATRTFQALRIAVNDELATVERGLEAALSVLRRGGRMVVLTYHSLEDRVVKNFFRERERSGELKRITRKVVTPSPEELVENPRSRSAKLRAAEKL